MSYDEFKKRIDTARNILVGAVPSPAGQIDQITYALIYKFMNDIDDQSVALGGKRTYFTGNYEKYNWHKIMSSTLGAHERLDLYRNAVQGMANNEHLPSLFRDIYRNAFLPFNSANVLTLFLKEIDKFSYSDSDDIGDAYEYLLSITGSQGDVGQFRTPRHIIKFIVEAVNPTKDDRVLDPAVGTAGFLIAAYNFVKSGHDGVDINNKPNGEVHLTADERSKVHKNYRGFDIDPTMVRTASVNMYLHGFTTPDIINHDSLSSENYWNDHYDVILANPPFMTPRGGIQPHKKFSVAANRAEVLFVDYIASHLKPSGRAGIVVPEGIIFQSGKAYKELRKNLIENHIYAVISLPAGVFQPYSGVKTSILLLDREISKKQNKILFVKIENDGLSLGSQRKSVAGNQLPEALDIVKNFQNGIEAESNIAHFALKSDIAESGDYNLSGDRYKAVSDNTNHTHLVVPLEEIASIKKGSAITKLQANTEGQIPVIAGGQKPAYYHDMSNRDPDVITVSASGAYAGFVNFWSTPIFASDCTTIQSKNKDVALDRYIFVMLKYLQHQIYKLQTGGGQPHIYPKDIAKLRIPLPSIEAQKALMLELDKYQKIIDAARVITETYKPVIKINPNWKIVKIGDHIKIERGASPRPIDKYMSTDDQGENWVMIGDTKNALKYIYKTAKKVTKEGADKSRKVEIDDFVLSNSMSFGKPYIMKTTGYVHDGWLILRTSHQKMINQDYLYYILGTDYVQSQFESAATGGVVRNLNSGLVRETYIPLPSVEEQRLIVEQLDLEQQLVDASTSLIQTFQEKIKDKIRDIWGE